MVIFDLCGTLFRSNTTFDFVKYYFPIRSLVLFSIPVIIINKLSISIFNFDLIRYFSVFCLKGLSEKEVAAMSERFYKNFLIGKEVCEVIELLEIHRDNAVIISATIEPVAEVIAKKLNVNLFIASQLETRDGLYTGKLSVDTLGRKSMHLPTDNISLVITDNKSDLDIINKSKKAIILSRSKDYSFWKKNIRTQDEVILINV